MGPIFSADQDHFFLTDSPGFSPPPYDFLGEDSGGYVYGLLSLADFNTPESALEYEAFIAAKTIRNLGSTLSNVEIFDNGFTLAYTDGDLCDADPSKRYRTDVVYKCDSRGDSIGTPMISPVDGDCIFEILWFSKFACRSCRSSDVDASPGKCLSSGNRIFTYEPKANTYC